MHLKQLKLAGFKSFVDPTTVPFPSQLVAVVGPNGCGKSNIIDAVRWVMGESSAKNLRGESMTDVIFNGSSQRKAVGQASVELLFDNSFGRLTGQYATYQEIAVKRVVTRDGDSSYYLNNTRCRRRDITDIFLGTGAGARGYSIIGQGTISRLIEARPEELRAYLEEAAGVSKYKERRRETLSRIEHTRENLARVSDIRDELDKQLQRLERQAKAAERYKALKAEERLCKIEILALKWQLLTNEQALKQNELMQLATQYEFYQAKAATTYKQTSHLREKFYADNDHSQQVQTVFYQLGTEIARLEESVQQNQREKQRLILDQQQMQTDWQIITSHLQQDKETLQFSLGHAKELQTSQAQIRLEFNAKQQNLHIKQNEQSQWQEQLQKVQTLLTQAVSKMEMERLRLQHLSQQRQQMMTRLEVVQTERTTINEQDLQSALVKQQEQQILLNTQLQSAEERYQHQIATELSLREQLTQTEKSLHQVQDNSHQLHVRHAALVAMQRTISNYANTPVQWQNQARMAALLTVEKQWQHACELVLNDGLQAIMVDSMSDIWPELPKLQNILFATAQQSVPIKKAYPTLADKIQGKSPHWITALDKIYTAHSLQEALLWVTDLADDESVITPEGHWLGKNWLKTGLVNTDDKISILQQQEELNSVTDTLNAVDEQLTLLITQRDDLHVFLKAQQQLSQQAQDNLSSHREELSRCEMDITARQSQLQQEQARKERLVHEIETLTDALEELVLQQQHSEQLLQSTQQTCVQHQQEVQQLTHEKITWENTLVAIKQEVDEARAILHQTELNYDREQLKIQQLRDNIEREQVRLETLNERLQTQAQRLMEIDTSESSLHLVLKEKIAQHQEIEQTLTGQREQLNCLTQELDRLETTVKAEENEARLIQEKIQQEQMQEQALAVRAASIIEALQEMDARVDTLLNDMPPGATQDLREQNLQDIVDKIKRLGAINLAAIEEYETEFQRKRYLDEQYNDLIEALTTLDTAIDKMDKETRQRLQETFDEVNTAFQALFPRLFGGGHARLELTSDNLLEAGVLVMAQPPGKRNSTIHLLSGGEKAMTAVALVFAIFQLNPSPFCMLDEVDAPLDDVNVGRFCDLVKEMSQFVQFLFITHNKVTMELADHLIGVTMREPGVSRIVAVDVEQALSLSDTTFITDQE